MSIIHDQIQHAVNGRHPVIYLQTPEEDRALQALEELAPQAYDGGTVTTWSCVSGLTPSQGDGDTRDAVAALEVLCADPRPGFYVLKDLAPFMNEPTVIRALRDAYFTLVSRNTTSIVIVSPVTTIPETLEKEICFVEVGLPEPDELLGRMREIQTQYPDVQIADEVYSEVALALRGLTLNEVTHVMHRIFRRGETDKVAVLEEVFAEKKVLARKSGYLEFVPNRLDMDHVGGLENVKDWALKRKSMFTQEAVNKGVPVPKGVLIMGVSGCGKSLLAKSIAHLWQVPLFRLDMNLVFSGLYGSPEATFHRALKMIEAVSPAVLWIDEIENGLGMTTDQSTPAQSLTFSAFLTWMQEKPPLVFVAATANRIESLPAEIIRKGRFDQVFFCDLPSDEERRAIIDIHLELNGAKEGNVEVDRLIVSTEGWSGAEIEQAIISARIDAIQEDRDFNTEDVKRHTSTMVPLSQTMAEQIKTIRRWAFDRATLASKAKRLY